MRATWCLRPTLKARQRMRGGKLQLSKNRSPWDSFGTDAYIRTLVYSLYTPHVPILSFV